MNEHRMAIDIESCALCPHLIFPGEDVLVLDDEFAHIAHEPLPRGFFASVA